MKDLLRSIYHVLKSQFYNSFSATGEDIIVNHLFRSVGKNKIQYMDIGTSSPIFGSNTYLFYRKGGRGVCVEANPKSYTYIKRVRTLDKCINAALNVGDKDEVDFFIFSDAGISTIVEQEADFRESFGSFHVVEKIIIPTVEINSLIQESFNLYPDFISIDIEGMDLEVLKNLDYARFPIPVICVETVGYAENYKRVKQYEIIDFMISKGYFLYADTFVNSILVNRAWYDNIPMEGLPKW